MFSGVRSAIALGIVVGAAVSATAQPQRPPRDVPAQQADATPGTAKVIGHVLDASTGQPMKRARVTLNGQAVRGRVVLTDDSGSFEFAQLPAGRFTLNAWKSGYLTLAYGQRRPLQPGTPLQVADGEQLKGIDVFLPRGSVISGRVLNEDGEAMPGTMVRVLRYQYLQGDRQLVPTGAGMTDDRGQYRVWGLNPGTYYVSAATTGGAAGGPSQFLAMAAQSGPGLVRQFIGGGGGQAVAGAPGEAPEAYAPTYFPGVSSARDAQAIPVGLGAEVQGIDFSVMLVPVSRVVGRVIDVQGAPARGAIVSLALAESVGPGENRAVGNRATGDGSFQLDNIPPGQYILSARAENNGVASYATQSFATSGGDTADVTLTLSPGAAFNGTVLLEGSRSGTPPDLTRLRIATQSTDRGGFGPPRNGNTGRVEADGSFTLDGVPPGLHFIRVQTPQGWTMKSVVVDGRETIDTGVDVRGGSKGGSIRVVLSDRTTDLNGTVTNEQRLPVTEYTVLAFSADPTLWRPQSRQIVTTRPDQNGRFEIRTLPAGDYFVTVINPEEPGEWYDPQVLEGLRGTAVRVSLPDGGTKTQDLMLSTSR